MALEQEIMEADKRVTEQKGTDTEVKNNDDLTDEEIEFVKELEQSEWWKVLCKCMDKRKEKQEKDLLVLAKDHFMEPKKLGYTAFEVLGGFIQWMGEMQRLVKVLTADPEEIQKAVEELQKAETELTEWKRE